MQRAIQAELWTAENGEWTVTGEREGCWLSYKGKSRIVARGTTGQPAGIPWCSADYLIFDVYSHESWSLALAVEFWKEDNSSDEPDIKFVVGVLFGALDRGLPSTGLKGVLTQEDRGIAYRNYVEQAASSKYCIGTHYFMLYDQAALGRFDGENYQIGFVDICHRPYSEIAAYAEAAHQAVYEVATETRRPYSEKPQTIAYIAF